MTTVEQQRDLRRQKLQKKLQNRRLSMFQALSQDIAADWLRTSNPAFISMLTIKTMSELISYVVVPGPIQNKLRSFKLPMAATELLSMFNGKLSDLFFLEDESGISILVKLLQYFQTTPNYVISGYVTKILMNLMLSCAPRVLECIMKFGCEKMLRFLQSQSIAQFVLRVLVVEDTLLTVHIKDRIKLLTLIIDTYAENRLDQDILKNIAWVLGECMIRFWTNKHKELGRFSQHMFRIAETVIDNTNLQHQQKLLITTVKHLVMYQKEAQGMIQTIYKKIYNEFLRNKSTETIKTQNKTTIPRFTQKKLKLLQGIQQILTHCPEAIVKLLPTCNIFSYLLDFVSKYEWNNMMLIQIEKIIKSTLLSNVDSVYFALLRAYFVEKLKQLIRGEHLQTTVGCGYSGFLKNIFAFLQINFAQNLSFAQYMRKNNSEGQITHMIEDYMKKKKQTMEHMYKVINQVAKPFYDLTKIPDLYKGFFQQTDAINARMLKESPNEHLPKKPQIIPIDIDEEYKLWTEGATVSLNQAKKSGGEQLS